MTLSSLLILVDRDPPPRFILNVTIHKKLFLRRGTENVLSLFSVPSLLIISGTFLKPQSLPFLPQRYKYISPK